MKDLSIFTFWALALLLAVQIPLAALLRSRLRSVSSQPQAAKAVSPEPTLPMATVILCLRGADPFLDDCLQGLVTQRYPNYRLQIVVDSREDSAWQVVEQTLKDLDSIQGLGLKQVQVSPLDIKHPTCGLKCSALIQAVSSLADDCEIVAFIDADTVPHSTWLRELAIPLADRTVGLTAGNRWYVPVENQWGSLVRYLWNSAAVAQMYLYTMPWGGSLALRRERFEQANLLERWKQALAEDVLLHSVMREQNLTVKFVPSLLMINREGCDLKSFTRWVSRQLVLVRLYHPYWWAIVGFTAMSSLMLGLAIGLLLSGVIAGQWQAAGLAAGGLALYLSGLVMLSLTIEHTVVQVAAARNEVIPKQSFSTLLKIVPAILLTQFVFSKAMFSAMRANVIEWRGIFYRIFSPWNIQLVKYQPYQTVESTLDRAASPVASL